MTATFATGAGSATPFVGQGVSSLAGPQGSRPSDEAPHHAAGAAVPADATQTDGPVSCGCPSSIAAADAILRAAGAVTVGEADV